MSSALTQSQRSLLEWLGKEDFSQYGECYGKDLDALLGLGMAEVHSEPEKQRGFIAHGNSIMYHAVSLTKAGHAARGQGHRQSQRMRLKRKRTETMKPIPQEWIKKYVDILLLFTDKLDENSPMRQSALLRADHAMDLVKAFREAKPQ